MMNPLTPATMLSCILFLFFMAALFKAVTLKKQKDLFLYKLAEANGFFDEVREELKDLHLEYDKTKQFKNSLTAAELTTQLQKPRLSAQTLSSTNSIPEKYSFVHSLIEKNMTSDEVASILSISCQEAEQLVTLAKLGGSLLKHDKSAAAG